MRRLIQLCLVVLLCAADAPAEAPMIYQRGRMFSATTAQMRRGEPIVFVNDDTVPHNIMSNSPENGFDLGSQAPGTAVTVRFDAIGTVAVICAIHPRMRMVVTVVE